MKLIGQVILIIILVMIILGIFYFLNSFVRPQTRFEDVSSEAIFSIDKVI